MPLPYLLITCCRTAGSGIFSPRWYASCLRINSIVELRKIGHRNINSGRTLLLKAIFANQNLIKFYVAVV